MFIVKCQMFRLLYTPNLRFWANWSASFFSSTTLSKYWNIVVFLKPAYFVSRFLIDWHPMAPRCISVLGKKYADQLARSANLPVNLILFKINLVYYYVMENVINYQTHQNKFVYLSFQIGHVQVILKMNRN